MDRLFGRGTGTSIGTEAAVEAWLGGEFTALDALGNLFYFCLRFLELQPVARCADGACFLEVVKHETLSPVSPLLLSRDGIDRELQAFIRILLRARLACLVVDNRYASVTEIIDPINAASNRGPLQAEFEMFFRMQDLGRRGLTKGFQEFLDLLRSLLGIEITLIGVFDDSLGKISTEQLNQLILRHWPLLANGIEIGSQNTVDGGSILHCSGNIARDSPFPFQLELQGTGLVGFDGRGAEAVQRKGRGQRKPLCRARPKPRRGRGTSEKIRL